MTAYLAANGSDVLTHVRKSSPASDDTAWAATVSVAVNALIDRRMTGTTVTTDMTAELRRAALQAGAAGYMERDAPHGVLSIGPDGETTRLSATLGRSLEPVFIQLVGPGIG